MPPDLQVPVLAARRRPPSLPDRPANRSSPQKACHTPITSLKQLDSSFPSPGFLPVTKLPFLNSSPPSICEPSSSVLTKPKGSTHSRLPTPAAAASISSPPFLCRPAAGIRADINRPPPTTPRRHDATGSRWKNSHCAMSPNSCTAGWWILIAATSQQATTTRDLGVPGIQRPLAFSPQHPGAPNSPPSIPFHFAAETSRRLLCFSAGCISVSFNLAGATVTVTLRQINPNQRSRAARIPAHAPSRQQSLPLVSLN